MKKYKYYFYYTNGDEYRLYAYTDRKEIAEAFEIYREPSMFIKKKANITREEANSLAKGNKKSLYLNMENFPTYDKNTNNRYTLRMSITMIESITISRDEYAIQSGIYFVGNMFWDYHIFNDNIINALEIVRYNMEYRAAKVDRGMPATPDRLGIFIKYFGKTLRSKKDSD